MAKVFVALQLDGHHKIKYPYRSLWNACQLLRRRDLLHNTEFCGVVPLDKGSERYVRL